MLTSMIDEGILINLFLYLMKIFSAHHFY